MECNDSFEYVCNRRLRNVDELCRWNLDELHTNWVGRGGCHLKSINRRAYRVIDIKRA